MAYFLGTLIASCVGGLAGIPAQAAMIDQVQAKAKALCRQARWNLHRSAQMDALTAVLDEDLHAYYEPALDMASSAKQTWQNSLTFLKVDKSIRIINAAILSIVMIVYVLLAWFVLVKKRHTLQEAFDSAHNIHFSP